MAYTDKELQKQIQFDIEFENTVQKTYNENIIMANEILQKDKTIEQSILSLYKFI